MQAKKRYLLVFSCVAFLLFCYFGGPKMRRTGQPRSPSSSSSSFSSEKLPSFLVDDGDDEWAPFGSPWASGCSKNGVCFNYSRCGDSGNDFKIHVYDEHPEEEKSELFVKIFNALKLSPYVTDDPDEACVFISGVDTLDRDVLSSDYGRNVGPRLARSALWNNGMNHLLFVVYAGTWPDYGENDLGFDPGHAMIARASASSKSYRPGFDISFPLFHKDLPDRGVTKVTNTVGTKTRLLGFKGKRYTYGIGSETRNALFHLHNGRDIVVVTTCKHGKSWKEFRDDRCDADQAEFDRYDYATLMSESLACLAPRGRRLGSFRFLEALRFGCLPVVLSNGWILPFSEVIDWQQAAFSADERLLFQVPDLVRTVSQDTVRIFKAQQQARFLWETYFSSIENIAATTIEIIKDRIYGDKAASRRTKDMWNIPPGGLVVGRVAGRRTPWDKNLATGFRDVSKSIKPNFTAVIDVRHPPNKFIPKLITQRLSKSTFVSSAILIFCPPFTSRPSPDLVRAVKQSVRFPVFFVVAEAAQCSVSTKFSPLPELFNRTKEVETARRRKGDEYAAKLVASLDEATDAVFYLDDDSALNPDEFDFALQVWKEFPEKIVGYPARSHYWDESRSSWSYTSKWTNDYSMVLPGSAVVHKYYSDLYRLMAPSNSRALVDSIANCEDILFNFVVARSVGSGSAGVKLTQRKQAKLAGVVGTDPDKFMERQHCIANFASDEGFGFMALVRSSVRFDPVLFKDQVSNMRKKYRMIETVGN